MSNLPKSLSAIAAMLGGLFGTSEDANASLRSDAADMIQKAINGLKMSGNLAGTLDSQQALQALVDSGKYKGSKGYFTQHGLVHRNEADGWNAGKIEKAYREIFDSPETVAIPNVLGVNPSAQEALWNQKSGIYMPIAPHRNGFKAVTIYDPEPWKIERGLRKKGWWEDGLIPSILPPRKGEPREPRSQLALSAVTSPVENKIRGFEGLVNEKKIIPPALLATALGDKEAQAAADPPAYARSLGIEEKPLEEPWWNPADLLTAPLGAGGAIAKMAAILADAPITIGINAAYDKILANNSN